ncbi:hypothetical protein BG006_009406 [Podila minutissima]|uniref:Uncharacterized protein n=1 Tax=Podila minutissima TaxID=64525 RepID=A0A9P5SHE5_9FUNG|nr:hypothetical protein BG006_009406 [Podila minutissima]
MNNLVEQAERVAHIVSEWFSGYQDAPAHTTHANAEDTHTTPSGAASYAASLASSYWNTYVHGEKGNASPPPSSSSFFSSSYSSLSSFRNQHQWLNDPRAALDSFLWNYTPDLRSLLHRFGLDENSMDMHIIALAMLLPVVLLLLVMVFSMGAGHTDENSHPGLQRHKVGPAVISGKKETGKGPSKGKGSGSTSSKTPKSSQTQHKTSGGAQDNIGPVIPIEGNTLGSWLALLGSSGFTGAEKLAYKPIDITAAMKELEKESKALDQHHAEHRSSWSSMMGAIGYAGGEMETHAPYKHLESKHLGHLLGDAARAHESAVGVPEQRHAKESVADKVKEDIIGPTAVQHEQDELGLDNQEQEDEDERLQRQEEEAMAARLIAFEEKSMAAAKIKADTVKAKAPSKKDAEESTTRPTYAAKVKTPMPGAFVEAQANLAMDHGTRGKKQVPESDGGSSSRSKPRPLRTRTPLPESSKHKPVAESSSPLALAEGSIGSRLWNYAQNSPFIKNVDSLSGGLLGTAVATVAVLANTAKAATTLVKDNVKLSDLADDLNDSFEYYMKTDSDTEDLGEISNGDSWGIRQAVGKINKMHDTEHLSKEDSQSELSFSIEDISLGPKTARSLQVPMQTDAGEESELSDREPELNEALLQRVKEPPHHSKVHPHDGEPGATTLNDGLLEPEQYTIDAQGNKIPITDARRDSGYDMLV